MSKRKKGKVIQMLSPENYIKQKARTLPIHECWINNGWHENGLANITVARKHSTGNLTIGLYLVDLKCLGIKEAQYFFNFTPFEYQELLDYTRKNLDIESVEYTLAHNIIYAGIEFAEEYGFTPHKDFRIAQYIIEEDSEDIELIEIECGYKGRPFYLRGPLDNETRVNQILAQLEKTAGPGNFDFVSDFEGFNFDDEDDDFENDENDIFDDELDFDENEVANSLTYQFKIQIQNISYPPVWRRVEVPSYFTFLHFHYIIQAAFDWLDEHLFSFSPGGYGTSPVIKEIDDNDLLFEIDSGRNLEASEIKLYEIFNTEGQKYTYIYDFGDDWHHKITLEKIVPETTLLPVCINGKGKCPPEDCGGVWGYENLKEILSDKKHPEYKDYKEWLGLEKNETWDPNEFNLEETQNILQNLFTKK